MGKLFNIVGTSIALMAHFAANPVSHGMKRWHHRLVLANLAKAPGQVPIRNLQHHKGHCYTFDIDQNLITDSFASSTILLFENGKPLKSRHTREIDKVIEKGGGRMFHNRDKLYFSTPDNSSPMSNGRGYVAVHSPTDDPDTFNRLQAYGKASKKSGAARFADMLAILCPRHFAFAGAEGDGPGVTLHQLRFAIDSKAEMRLTAERLTIERGRHKTWSFTLQDIESADGAMPVLTIRGLLDLAMTTARWFRQIEITGPDGLELGMTTFDDGTLALTAARPDFLRAPLLENFRDEAELQRWIAQLFERLCGPLAEGGFGLRFDDAARATFFAMLKPETPPARYVFSTPTAPENRQVKLERLPLAG